MSTHPIPPGGAGAACSGASREAYAILRLSLGLNILIHGGVRLPHPLAFAQSLVGPFAQTPIPAPAVLAFGVLLPFLEGAVGLLLVLGWHTRWALRAGGCLMVMLVAGTALRSDWHTVGIQMIYSGLYFLLHRNLADNGFALDTLGRGPAA